MRERSAWIPQYCDARMHKPFGAMLCCDTSGHAVTLHTKILSRLSNITTPIPSPWHSSKNNRIATSWNILLILLVREISLLRVWDIRIMICEIHKTCINKWSRENTLYTRGSNTMKSFSSELLDGAREWEFQKSNIELFF